MLIDSYGRTIDYLRISLTQRCNFRCLYCMPKTPFEWTPKENVLSFDELFLFVKVCIDEGVKKVRLTGGEPLLRDDLHRFIKMLIDYAPYLDLALTTNGFLLPEKAPLLAQAGLKRVNISLDSLKHTKAKFMAQKNVLDEVLLGINTALECGLKVKLNCVPIIGVNDDEIIDLIEFARAKGVQIRFIEFMENEHAYGQLKGLKMADILARVKEKYELEQIERDIKSPAQLFKIDDYVFGIINPHQHDFCESCNRLRLSAEGFLIPCLYFDEAMSIRKALKNKDINKAVEILATVLKNKPEKNKWGETSEGSTQGSKASTRAFYQTGG